MLDSFTADFIMILMAAATEFTVESEEAQAEVRDWRFPLSGSHDCAAALSDELGTHY